MQDVIDIAQYQIFNNFHSGILTISILVLSVGILILLILSPSTPPPLNEKERSYINPKTKRKLKFPHLLKRGK